jgi:hypothetical protein
MIIIAILNKLPTIFDSPNKVWSIEHAIKHGIAVKKPTNAVFMISVDPNKSRSVLLFLHVTGVIPGVL